MKIAVLSPISWRTPPRHYGPWELFASLLVEGLRELGHDVTLFATGDSLTSARLVSTTETGWSESSEVEPKVAECIHIASVFERADEFDVIHNGFDFLPLTYSRLVHTPVVTTIHGFSSEKIVPVYARYNDIGAYVAISSADRHPALTYAGVVHHGIDLAEYRLHPSAGEDLLFFGRIHPDKGTAEAIEVARAAGRRLVIAGIVQDADYFNEKVKPFIDGDRVVFVGPVGASNRAEILGGAYALLHLINFDEPFGLSVVEAMACGTPVIASDRGSMPEIIADGKTGFLVRSTSEAERAVERVAGLDRSLIADTAACRFDYRRMAREYQDIYVTLLSGGATTS